MRIYVTAVRAWWWVLLLVAGGTVAAAAIFTARQDRVYFAAATAAVVPAPELVQPTDVMRALETLERRTVIATFASVAEARETLDSVVGLLGATSPDLSGYRVRATVVPNTNVIRVGVEGRDPGHVPRMANLVVEVLGRRAREMYRIFALRPLGAAVPPKAALRPEPRRNLVVAAVVGVFAGLLLVIGLEYLRRPPP